VTPESAVALYLAELAEQRRQSPHTISNYRRDLNKLLQGAGETALADLRVHHIRRQISQLHARGLSGRTLSRTLSAWRGFFSWLGQRGAVSANPCDGIRAPKSPKYLPNVLSVDEASRLLSEVTEEDPALAARDGAMFELFYSSGLRLAELAALNVDALQDIDDSGELRVLGKRSKLRLVPVGSKAREALKNWAQYRPSMAAEEETALFVGRRGQRISHRVIQLRLQQQAVRAGLPRHVHPHMLRHSFASHVLQSSGDLRAVQEMLGHASIASTQVYTHLDFQHLAKVYDAAHPRSKRS
jgi:integrase/recombinase XerC